MLGTHLARLPLGWNQKGRFIAMTALAFAHAKSPHRSAAAPQPRAPAMAQVTHAAMREFAQPLQSHNGQFWLVCMTEPTIEEIC
jgi:hypothetical protein